VARTGFAKFCNSSLNTSPASTFHFFLHPLLSIIPYLRKCNFSFTLHFSSLRFQYFSNAISSSFGISLIRSLLIHAPSFGIFLFFFSSTFYRFLIPSLPHSVYSAFFLCLSIYSLTLLYSSPPYTISSSHHISIIRSIPYPISSLFYLCLTVYSSCTITSYLPNSTYPSFISSSFYRSSFYLFFILSSHSLYYTILLPHSIFPDSICSSHQSEPELLNF
jgi:hypothetical protein